MRLEIKSEDILDKIAIDMCPEKTGNYKMLYMRKIGTPMIFRKRQLERSRIAEEQQPKRIKEELINSVIKESRRCEIFTISVHLKNGVG